MTTEEKKNNLIRHCNNTIDFVTRQLKKQAILIDSMKNDDTFNAMDFEECAINVMSVLSSQLKILEEHYEEYKKD